MPIVDIHLIEGVFDKDQKQEMIRKVTDAMVDIEGETMRGVTWVRLYEVASGEWGMGGKGITTADVKAMQAGEPPALDNTLARHRSLSRHAMTPVRTPSKANFANY